MPHIGEDAVALPLIDDGVKAFFLALLALPPNEKELKPLPPLLAAEAMDPTEEQQPRPGEPNVVVPSWLW